MKLLSKLLALCCLFIGMSVNAQMYVGPSTNVFAKNIQVYVTGNLELNASTSNFYLRDEAQLLQGRTGAAANTGSGNLSLYQEGTVNNFNFNYWGAPVHNPATGKFSINQMKAVTGLTTSVAPAITTSWDGSSVDNTSLSISSAWVNKYVSGGAFANWAYVGSAETINPGEGFTLKGSTGKTPANGQRYDIVGRPNDGDISVDILASNYVLLGNPYPSALNLQQFLQDNTTIEGGAAYFLETKATNNTHYVANYVGGYGTYSFGTNVYVPASYYAYDNNGNSIGSPEVSSTTYDKSKIPVGQGFFVRGNPTAPANSKVTFKNSHRLFAKEDPANGFKFSKKTDSKSARSTTNSSELSYIWLSNFIGEDANKPTLVVFGNGLTDNLDRGYDAYNFGSGGPSDAYLMEASNELTVLAQEFNMDKKIQIGFENEEVKVFRVSVKNLENFTQSNDIFIHDKQTGIYSDIKNGVFEVTLPPGTHNNRFEITFKQAALSNEQVEVQNSFKIYHDKDNNQIVINNPLSEEVEQVTLYDVVGKQLNTQKMGTAATASFATSQLAEGIYIVKGTTKGGISFNKKLIVSR